jgi:hypothetical protein
LSSGLQYTPGVDEIGGIVGSGSFKNQELADHALVFMIRGIKKKFKQPVAYSFCQGATNQHQLMQQLKEVIKNFMYLNNLHSTILYIKTIFNRLFAKCTELVCM